MPAKKPWGMREGGIKYPEEAAGLVQVTMTVVEVEELYDQLSILYGRPNPKLIFASMTTMKKSFGWTKSTKAAGHIKLYMLWVSVVFHEYGHHLPKGMNHGANFKANLNRVWEDGLPILKTILFESRVAYQYPEVVDSVGADALLIVKDAYTNLMPEGKMGDKAAERMEFLANKAPEEYREAVSKLTIELLAGVKFPSWQLKRQLFPNLTQARNKATQSPHVACPLCKCSGTP